MQLNEVAPHTATRWFVQFLVDVGIHHRHHVTNRPRATCQLVKNLPLAFAAMVRGLQVPEMATPATVALAAKVAEGVAELASRIEKAANSL